MIRKFDYNKMPIVEVVNEIMVDAAKRGASDIHFDPLENFMKVRIRIDGALIDYAMVPNDIKKNLITRIKIISGMNITESRLPQDGAIKATLQGISLDLRVSTIPTNMGEKIVIRILDYSLSGAGIENLGFSDKNYKKVIEMINQPNGIILVTGATGTGKSTTVYSVLQRLNKEESNIITVEDPVEMNIEGVNQIQANSEIGLDFATALRSILRQDPNIIMIGEIRDSETAQIAIRASITGHLVLSTLHTNDSLNTIERLLDMDVERYLLASSLTGIIAQKLARRLCPHCRKEIKPNKFEQRLFESVLGHKVNKIYAPVGCDQCRNGYKGRIAIQEVLLINQQIRDAINSNYRKNKLRNLVYNNDVDSLLQDGLQKVEQGLTSIEELLKLIELEHEDSAITKMGMDDSIQLAQDIENAFEKEKEEEKLEEQKEEINDTSSVIEEEVKQEEINSTDENDTVTDTDQIIEELLNENLDIVDENDNSEKDKKKNKKKKKNEELNEKINEEIDPLVETEILDEEIQDKKFEDEILSSLNDLDNNNDNAISYSNDDFIDFNDEKDELEDTMFNFKADDDVDTTYNIENTSEFNFDFTDKNELDNIINNENVENTIDLDTNNVTDENDNLSNTNDFIFDFNDNVNSNNNENESLFDKLNNVTNDEPIINFADAKGSDLIINGYEPKQEDTLDLESLNFDIDEPTIDLTNVKIDPVFEPQEGLLDDNLEDASDDDIMNLFN